jgi:putative tryptophan/tyrosine transport system substrate-binding protein
MKRREFVSLLGLAAAVWGTHARAQSRPPFRIAVIGSGSREDRVSANEMRWLKEGLEDEGLVEGRHFTIEARYAEGDYSRFEEIAREMLAHDPGAFTVSTIAAARSARELTASVPIVMLGLNDPVGTGLVSTLAQPGGNVTGVATMNEDLQLKLFQMTREILPNARKIAAVANPRNPSSFAMIAAIRAEADAEGMTVEAVEVVAPDALDSAFEGAAPGRPDVFLVVPDVVLAALSTRIVATAALQRVPVVGTFEELTAAGALMSYGRVRQETVRRAASYLKRIAEGGRPGDMPVEQPTRFRLVINTKTANALGIEVPPGLLVRADEVIE